MITADRIKEIEAKKAEAIAAFDLEIKQAKEFETQRTELVALSAKYKFATLGEFLAAHGFSPTPEKKTKGPKAAKTAKAKGPSDLKKGPPSGDEKALILSLQTGGKSVAEIAAQLKRSEDFVSKYLKK